MGEPELLTTPLDRLHRALDGRMVPFAGYSLPVQYPAGILREHEQVRTAAGLFDVSHMGQARLTGPGAAAVLERLVPGDIGGLKAGRMRYTLLLNDQGGILDDLMVTRLPDAEAGQDRLLLIVNAAVKTQDLEHIGRALPDNVTLEALDDRALLALQGPQAAPVMARLCPPAVALPFMAASDAVLAGAPVWISRSGYTGEDGFEISVSAADAEAVARLLLDQAEVAPAGLGARDSLRLEAGLCLYGHDIDQTTTPIEAGLAWTVAKRRREQADFPGATPIMKQLADGPHRRRVGLRLEGRQPAREGAVLVSEAGTEVGRVTSGSFAPTVGAPVAMGFVATEYAGEGTPVGAVVRGRTLSAQVAAMPFVPPRYVRKPSLA